MVRIYRVVINNYISNRIKFNSKYLNNIKIKDTKNNIGHKKMMKLYLKQLIVMMETGSN